MLETGTAFIISGWLVLILAFLMSFPCAGLDITGQRTAQHIRVTLKRDLISTPYGITMSYADDNGSKLLLALPITLRYDTTLHTRMGQP